MALVELVLGLVAGPMAPATFYNRPGATPAVLAHALEQCRAIATGPMAGGSVDRRVLTPPVGAATSPQPIGAVDAVAECMIARGWRLFLLSADEQAALASLIPRARARVMDRLIAARRPGRGRLLREDGSLLLRGVERSGVRDGAPSITQ